MRLLPALFILCIIAFPATLVFAESTSDTGGGVMFMSPEEGTYAIGDVFDVRILVDTGGKAVNAAEADLTFNKSGLEVESISRGGSILEAWSTEPAYSNGDGTIKFSGWMRQSFTGPSGLLLTIRFKAVRNQTSNVRFATGAILDANSNGSNIAAGLRSAAFTIAPKQVAPTPEKSSNTGRPPRTDDAAPTAPTILEYTTSVKIGERLILKGAANPDTLLRFTLKKNDGTEIKSVVMSAGDGSFTYVSDDAAEEGIYHVSAQHVSPSGIAGPPSPEITITAAPERLAAAVGLLATTTIDLLPFLSLLVVAGLGTGYLFHRHKIEKLKHELAKK